MGDARWIELQVPGAETMVVLFKNDHHQPDPMPSLVFVADNVASTYAELKGKGVEFTPKKERWGSTRSSRTAKGI